ncbi:hypothetical protein F4809DRAFT_637438 [Biscogniauxia mediterranea]|nr:hypothetical protein F4809DRAFT_637438 [Biscogniauxia mediterranea]
MAYIQDISPTTYVEGGDLTDNEDQRFADLYRQIKEIVPHLQDEFISGAYSRTKAYVFRDLWKAYYVSAAHHITSAPHTMAGTTAGGSLEPDKAGDAWEVSYEAFYHLVYEGWWKFLMRNETNPPPFPYPRPDKYGPPYSRVLLDLCSQAESDKAREDKLAEGYKRELPRRTPEDTFDQGVLESIWSEVLPGRPYEKYCGPFQWTLPSDVVLHHYVGDDMEDLLHTMNRIATMMGRDLVLVCARGDLRDVYPDVPREEARLVRFELGPAEQVDVKCPGFLTRIHKAWLDLFKIHADILAGEKFSMVDRLRDMYREQLVKMTSEYDEKRKEAEKDGRVRMVKKVAKSFANSSGDDLNRLSELLTMQNRAVMKDARRAAATVLAGCSGGWKARRDRLDAFVTGKANGKFACLEWRDLAMLVLPFSEELGTELLQRELDMLQENLRTFDDIRVFCTRLEIVLESFAELPTKYYDEAMEEWLDGILDRIDAEEQK